MAKKTVAELAVETLYAAGVRHIYGVAGDSLNGITDTLRAHPDMQWIPVRHEETAAFAAGAEAHLTGKLAVCAGSCGPGNLHLINGLYDCQRNRVPVVAIAAHIPSSEIGSGYFQETHPELIFKECSHYVELVSSPSQMPRTLEIAMQTAIAKRGVAVIVLPGDVGLREATTQEAHSFPYVESAARPTAAGIAELAAALNEAKRITILGGAGCKGAHDELVALAGKLKAPVVHAMRGKEYIEYDNPYDVGMTGLLGFSSGYKAMLSCDLLLMLGTDFPYRQFYPKKAKVVQVDAFAEQIGRRAKVDLGVVGDVKATLAELLPAVKDKKNDSFLRSCLDDYKSARRGLDDLAVNKDGDSPMHPQFVAKTLNETAADDAIFTVDVGTPVIWAARYLQMNGKRRMLGSFNHGSMANAMPQAIGAAISQPGRQVITLSGDGGVSMLMGDLLTLRQLNLPVKMIVFNNGSLGFVEMEMKATGFLDYATELYNPNLARIAEGAGIYSVRVDDAGNLKDVLQEAFAQPGPAFIDVNVHRTELAMPPSLQLNQVVDFNLYMMKAILNGRGNEVLDMAKVNLLR